MDVYLPDNFVEIEMQVSLIDHNLELMKKGFLQDAVIISKPERAFVYGKQTSVNRIDLEKARNDGIKISRAPIGSSKRIGVICFSGEMWTFRWCFKGNQEERNKALESKKLIAKEFYKLVGIEISEITTDIEVKGTEKKLSTFYFKDFPDKEMCFGGFGFNLNRGGLNFDDYISLPDSKFEGKECKTINERITTISEEGNELDDAGFLEVLKQAMTNAGVDYQIKELPEEVSNIVGKGIDKFSSKEWIEEGRKSNVKDYGKV